jgi:hypothetical protein
MKDINLGSIKLKTHLDGESLFIGKIKIGSYFYDGCRPKDDPNEYKVVSEFNDYCGHFKTPKECEKILIELAHLYVNKLKGVK